MSRDCPYCNYTGTTHCGDVAAAIKAMGGRIEECSNAKVYGARSQPVAAEPAKSLFPEWDKLRAATAPAAPVPQPLSDEQIEALEVWEPFIGLWRQSRREIARAVTAEFCRINGIGIKGASMSERDLLERAAKAAGIVIDKSPSNGGGSGNDGFDVMGNAILDWHNGVSWNPLTDDGDALRLAVKLRIDLLMDGQDIQSPLVEAIANIASTGEVKPFAIEALDTGDPYSATRRAIVRAAAAMSEAGK